MRSNLHSFCNTNMHWLEKLVGLKIELEFIPEKTFTDEVSPCVHCISAFALRVSPAG